MIMPVQIVVMFDIVIIVVFLLAVQAWQSTASPKRSQGYPLLCHT